MYTYWIVDPITQIYKRAAWQNSEQIRLKLGPTF